MTIMRHVNSYVSVPTVPSNSKQFNSWPFTFSDAIGFIISALNDKYGNNLACSSKYISKYLCFTIFYFLD